MFVVGCVGDDEVDLWQVFVNDVLVQLCQVLCVDVVCVQLWVMFWCCVVGLVEGFEVCQWVVGEVVGYVLVDLLGNIGFVQMFDIVGLVV